MCLVLTFSLHAPGLMEMYLLMLHNSNALEGNVSIYAYAGIMYGCWEGKGQSFRRASLRETSYYQVYMERVGFLITPLISASPICSGVHHGDISLY